MGFSEHWWEEKPISQLLQQHFPNWTKKRAASVSLSLSLCLPLHLSLSHTLFNIFFFNHDSMLSNKTLSAYINSALWTAVFVRASFRAVSEPSTLSCGDGPSLLGHHPAHCRLPGSIPGLSLLVPEAPHAVLTTTAGCSLRDLSLSLSLHLGRFHFMADTGSGVGWQGKSKAQSVQSCFQNARDDHCFEKEVLNM